MFRISFYFLCLISLWGCGAQSSTQSPAEVTQEKPVDEILFVMLKMTKTDSGNAVVITSTNIGKGTMKPEILRPIDSGNFLTVEIYQDGKRSDIRHIEHPLLKNVEYVNENNQFSTQTVTLQEAEFFIRLQKKGTTKIKIGETINHKTANQWQTFTITP